MAHKNPVLGLLDLLFAAGTYLHAVATPQILSGTAQPNLQHHLQL